MDGFVIVFIIVTMLVIMIIIGVAMFLIFRSLPPTVNCLTQADCRGGDVCSSGMCKPGLGMPCSGTCGVGVCTSGICVVESPIVSDSLAVNKQLQEKTRISLLDVSVSDRVYFLYSNNIILTDRTEIDTPVGCRQIVATNKHLFALAKGFCYMSKRDNKWVKLDYNGVKNITKSGDGCSLLIQDRQKAYLIDIKKLPSLNVFATVNVQSGIVLLGRTKDEITTTTDSSRGAVYYGGVIINNRGTIYRYHLNAIKSYKVAD